MLLASYALACVVESRPVTCPLVFHLACRPASRPVSHRTCRPVFPPVGRLAFPQTYPPVFPPVCHSAGMRMCRYAATVSLAARRGQSAVSLSGCRRPSEMKASAGGWLDSWCARHQAVHRVVHPAVSVRIPVRLVLVRFPVWIL